VIGRTASGADPLAVVGRRGGMAAVLLAYLLVHVLLRLVVSDSLTADDAREALYGQTLAWGYQAAQPPLYNWAVWAAFQALGVSLLTLTVVKYAFLGIAYAFVYASARRLVPGRRLAALATLSLWLVVPINWTLHEALTHSVAGLAACAATFYALLRLEDREGPGAYGALGLALGLGLLAKFSVGIFAAGLLLAALTLPHWRRRLLRPHALLAMAVAVAVVLPYAWWFTGQDFRLLAMLRREVGADPTDTYVGGVASGLYYVIRVSLYYLTPLWLVLLFLLPEVYARRPGAPEGLGRPLLARFHLTVLGVLVAGTLAGSLGYLKFRWLIPAFFLVPVYAFSRLPPDPPDARRLRRYSLVLLAAELLVVAGIGVRVYAGRYFARASRFNAPYGEIAARMAAAGFRRGTIVVGVGTLAGNLRLHFPGSRVVFLENPGYVPPPPGGGQCLVAWEDRRRGAMVPPDLSAWLAAAFRVPIPADPPVQSVETSYRHDDDRLRVHFIFWPDGAGTCR
jgi:4-amino-4-deoxy-L-arabinose transferase-like glycosyltransferase